MSLIIKDKFVLITGSTSDIGFAIAKDLAINSNLILHGRDIEMLKKLASEITNKKRILLWEYDLNIVENLSADFTLFLETNGVHSYFFSSNQGEINLSSLIVSTVQFRNSCMITCPNYKLHVRLSQLILHI